VAKENTYIYNFFPLLTGVIFGFTFFSPTEKSFFFLQTTNDKNKA